ALVLCEPFARFKNLVEATAAKTLPRPVAWLVDHISLPVASLHAGSNLGDLAPIDSVEKLWPRPVLVVHGNGKSFMTFDQTMELYQAMPAPKEQFWPAVDQPKRKKRAKGDAAILSEMFREYLGVSDGVLDDPGVSWRI